MSALAALAGEYPDVRFQWNARFGTPSSVLRYGETLTGPAASAADAALGWLSAHAALFGWSAADVQALRVVKELEQPDGGPKIVLFHQVFSGLEGGSFGGSLTVALDPQNRVLTVRGNVLPAARLTGVGALDAGDAFAVVSGVSAPAIAGVRAGWFEFQRGPFAGPHFARQIAFPMPGAPARRAWEISFAKRIDEGYRAVVDAATGELLYHASSALHAVPEGRVFPNYPRAPLGGQQVLMSFAGDPRASPQGWLSPLSPGGPLPTTAGNNATTATNWAGIFTPDGPGQLRPVDPDLSFDYPFTDSWANSMGSEVPPGYAPDALPAVVNLFYHHNRAHDFWYGLGFNEAAGALQMSNFGRGGQEGDPLIGMAQTASIAGEAVDATVFPFFGRNNAFMFPNPDGLPCWSGQFLFEPVHPHPADAALGYISFITPYADGSFEADLIHHEYAHAVTTRWAGGEYGNLSTYQGGSMGEAWGDFFSLHYLFSQGLETKPVFFAYADGNYTRGGRNWALDEVPVGFGDIGYDNYPDVHSDGEIWSGLLWAIRTEFARGDAANGAALAARLIADAIPLSGPLPSMLDMRDAILAADLARTGGANQQRLWRIFAKRGTGFSALTNGGDDMEPRPAFDCPNAHNAGIEGLIVDAATRHPITGSRVIIGDYEAGVTAMAQTSENGAFQFPVASGTYLLRIQASGYGSRTLSLDVSPGKTRRVQIKLTPNLASLVNGASVVEQSALSPFLALDDTESTAAVAQGTIEDQVFTVRLAGEQTPRVQAIQVSAFPQEFGIRESAVRDFTVLASTDGTSFREILRGSFPTEPPRPVVPELHYKTWTLPRAVTARFLKFVAHRPIDLLTGQLLVAEFQAFAKSPVVVDQPEPGGPFHDEGRALVPVTGIPSPTGQVMCATGSAYPPPTQGLDAWVSRLPNGVADGVRRVRVRGESLAAGTPVAMFVAVLDEHCRLLAQSYGSGTPEEFAPLSPDARFVLSAPVIGSGPVAIFVDVVP